MYLVNFIASNISLSNLEVLKENYVSVLCKDLKPSDAKPSHPINVPISLIPLTVIHQNIYIIEMAGI